MRKKITSVKVAKDVIASNTKEIFPYDYDLRSYIVVLENVMSYKLCDMLLDEYEKTDLWEGSRVGGGPSGGVVNKEIRNVDSIGFSLPHIINQNPEKRQLIDTEVYKSVTSAMARYNQMFNNASISKDSGYELLRYKKGGFYKQHCDSFTHNMRTISCSLAVNDNFSGGEFAFFNREIIKEVPKGAALLFPSTFLYPHEVMPVTKGTRYSIITWLM